MPAFNFFRIYPQQKSNLSQLLNSKGIVFSETKSEIDNGIPYIYELFFTQRPLKKPIKWIKELKKQFTITDHDIEINSAVVIISFLNSVYAISYGLAHIYVSRYADYDFGINIASRLVASYKTKNSREFGGVKTKSIETYLSPDELAFEAGEAVNYIKGIPIDKEIWGKNISCGQSVQLRKRNFSIKNIHRICVLLENALTLPIVKDIPRSITVKDPGQIQTLNAKLVSDMQSGYYMFAISQQQLSGVAFFFSDQYDFILKAEGIDIPLDENITLSEIDALVNSSFHGDYNDLLKASVEAQEDGSFSYSSTFINFIDYVDTQGNYYLDDGKWYRFDNNYLSNVRNEVSKIPLDFSTEIPIFNENAYSAWLALHPGEQHYYRERYLNHLLELSYGYINHDRTFDLFEGTTIEIADLIKANTIYIVKIGKPQKLNYAIDQASAAIKVLERRNYEIPVFGNPVKIQKVCLWLFIERQNRINQISEINSLIFLMKLANWRKNILLSGLQPEIRISYK